jgi:CotH kinase protein
MPRIYLLLFATCLGFSLKAQNFTASNLPIILIETNGQAIPNEPKIEAKMKIIYNGVGQINNLTDPANEYNGAIGIEIRGASSSNMPQTPYAIETRDSDGNDDPVSLFGMPEESDWCLLSNYNEKTFARNALAFQLFRDMGHYAPRTQLVEVMLDGQYKGIYLFCERIKRDKNRVNITKADDMATTGDSLSGGYIFKIDYWDDFNSWASPYIPAGHPNRRAHFVYTYPKPDEATPSQKNYLQSYVTQAEDVLYGLQYSDPSGGFRDYFDTPSFIDYFLLNEVARNNDGSKKSRFFYKDRDSKDARIKAGPVWDFDWAWKNIAECSIFAATDGSGWSYKINECNPDNISPDWYNRMLTDTLFKSDICLRYDSLRGQILATTRLIHFIDSIALVVKDAQLRHYQKWPILADNGWAPETNFTPTNYEGEISRLKKWVTDRMNWLDKNIPKFCEKPSTIVASTIKMYPNPAHNRVTWNGYRIPRLIMVATDVLGRETDIPLQNDEDLYWFDVSGLPNGSYFIGIKGRDKIGVEKLVVVR